MASTEAVINWFRARQGRVTYSMTNRLGPNSYDCSSAVYFALIEAGFLPGGTSIGNTESLYRLEGSLLQPINRSEAKEAIFSFLERKVLVVELMDIQVSS